MTEVPAQLVDEIDARQLAEVFADGEMTKEGWKLLNGAEPSVRQLFYF